MTVILGLGSNIGDRLRNIKRGIEELAFGPAAVLSGVIVSPLYESDALLPEGQAGNEKDLPFYNLAVAGHTGLNPEELLQVIKSIEARVGRQKRERWAPRELDIDILVWDSLSLRNENLSIPHTELPKRPFALWPLADLDPHRTLVGGEGKGRRVLELAAAMGSRFASRAWNPAACNTRRADEETQIALRREIKSLGLRSEDGSTLGAKLVGIVNVTPDSFSDDAFHDNVDGAVSKALAMIAEGAEVIDIGAESTRPGAKDVSPEIEWQRLEPVLRLLHAELNNSPKRAVVSLDSRHPEVVSRAMDFGIDWVNDVTGGRNPELRRKVLERNLRFVVMHSLSVPVKKRETIPENSDPVAAIVSWAEDKVEELLSSGFSREQIIIDPGIGFGKSPSQSREIIIRSRELRASGCDVLVGHSRKSFMSLFTPLPAGERDVETAALSPILAEQGVKYIRVHNVRDNLRAMRAYTVMKY